MLEENLRTCRSLYRSLFLVSIIVFAFSATIETFRHTDAALMALRIIESATIGTNDEEKPITARLPEGALNLIRKDPAIADAARAFYAPFEDKGGHERSLAGEELFPLASCQPPTNGSVYDWQRFIAGSFPVIVLHVPNKTMRQRVEETLRNDHLETLDAIYENDSLRVRQQALPECNLNNKTLFDPATRVCGWIEGELTANGVAGHYYGGGPQRVEVCGSWREVGKIRGLEWFESESPERLTSLEEFSDSAPHWSLWSEIISLDVSQAIKELEILKQKNERGLSIAGVTVNGALASLLGVGAIAIMVGLLYGHINHLQHIVRIYQVNAIPAFPWVGLFPSRIMDLVNFLVLTVIPVSAQVFVLYKTAAGAILLVVSSLFIAASLTMGWLSFKLLMMLRGHLEIELSHD